MIAGPPEYGKLTWTRRQFPNQIWSHLVVRLIGRGKHSCQRNPHGSYGSHQMQLPAKHPTVPARLGPVISGKSTLLHLIGPLDRPTSGDVIVAGHRVSALSDRDLSAVRARFARVAFGIKPLPQQTEVEVGQ
jgi:ABC-type proline/glycine betaine transport system ATPase subunit